MDCFTGSAGQPLFSASNTGDRDRIFARSFRSDQLPSFGARRAQQRAVLKEAADEIANRVNGLFNVRGWPLSWSSHGSIASVAKRWRESTLVELLKSQANVDLETRISTLTTRIEALRKAL